ncbi:MFS transporter [Nocardioides pyridinolyticus]
MTSSLPGTATPPGTLDQHDLYRRSLTVVVISQVFGGAGLAAGVIVGALLAQDMLGGDGAAGLPAALFTLGSALAAFTVGRVSQQSGRRLGLAGGFIVGALGAAGIVLAAVLDNPVLFFIALLVYGSGTATNLQARYAGTDLAPPRSRGTAVSIAMVSTTLGAVAGPNSVDALGDLAETLGIPALAGPFLLAAVAYGIAGVILFVFLRPDPLITARQIAHDRLVAAASAPDSADVDSIEPVVGSPGAVALGATIMVLSQIAMVAIMTMTPVHMRHHDHSLGDVGFVIGMHIGAMFLPSLVTGRLVDRIGRVPMAIASAITLLAAGLVAAFAPGDSMRLLTLALVLLGLGWNFGLISGTALIVDATTLETRAKTQGAVDVLIAIAGAGGGAMSGVIVGLSSYATLALAGGFLAVLLIPAVAWHQYPRRSLRG